MRLRMISVPKAISWSPIISSLDQTSAPVEIPMRIMALAAWMRFSRMMTEPRSAARLWKIGLPTTLIPTSMSRSRARMVFW